MPKSIYGKKLRMTKYYDEAGREVPVTAILAGPCPVVQVKTGEKDGYRAIQVGFEPHDRKKGLNKPMAGHFEKNGVDVHRKLREIRLMEDEEYKPGDVLEAGQFASGDFVDVSGVSKGKGFAGGVKRHGWGGGRATHGSMFHRGPGSIGQSAYPSRVIKGKTLPGRMGNERVTTLGLQVVNVDAENNVIYIRGSVPGPNGGLVYIRESLKKKKAK
jgi:large subunit ribosomal protein L3